MVSVSNGFLSALRSGAEQDIRLEFASGAIIDKAQISANGGFQYQQILNASGDMAMGKAVESNIEVTLLNIDGYLDNFDFTEEFTAKYGVKVGYAFEYVSLGVFKGERPERIKTRIVNFMAADRMKLFEKDASEFIEDMTFPVTISEVFVNLCDFVGIEHSVSTFLNGDKSLEFNPFESSDHTCREVLAWLAEAMCSYAMIDRDGKVNLVWFAETDYTVTKSDRFELSQSELSAQQISKLEVYTSYSDMLNTSGTGDNLYTISDNPFLYAENDEDKTLLQIYADNIYSRLAEFPEYFPSAFRSLSNPAVECGDIITVISDDGSPLTFPVFMQTLKWSAKGKTEYENTGNIKRENVPTAQRELENLKKNMLRNTDLTTSIDSYLSTEKGQASIVTAVEGKFVTSDTLKNYVTTAKLTQEITKVDAQISLEAAYGSGTIGSNVRAMLTLFANADSSSIKLKSDAIDLTGYVTVTALNTPGATTINGANVTTDNLYVKKIYGDKGTAIEDIMVFATSGRNIALGNGDTSVGLSTNLTIWANNIVFASRNNLDEDERLVINTLSTDESVENISYKYPQCIYPYSPYGAAVQWSIGNEDFPFGRLYLDNSLYLYDRDTEGWARIYSNNDRLYFYDSAGYRTTLV